MIYVYQRHCVTSENSDHKKRPAWFSKELALHNLLEYYTEDVEFTFLLDGRLADHFLFKRTDLNVIPFTGGSECASFLFTLDYIFKQNHQDDDIIYILEDDYVHMTGWDVALEEGFRELNIDYITLYDHPDKYTRMYAGIPITILPTKNVHWRTTPSTTNTFACQYKTLKKHAHIHREFSDLKLRYTRDHLKFTTLWQSGSNLVSPIPGYSTHCEPEFLSPTIDWAEVI